MLSKIITKNALHIVLIIYLIMTFATCNEPETPNMNYRQEMRNFVIKLSDYAKTKNPEFIIIPQNGQELITNTGTYDGIMYLNYIRSIDATAREDLFYGFEGDNIENLSFISEDMVKLCTLYQQMGVEVMAIDYCSSPEKIDSSYAKNNRLGFISFAAPERNLNCIPSYPAKPFNENGNAITSIHSIQNFLYLINSEKYATKAELIEAVSATYYDLVVIDLFHFGEAYSKEEVSLLQKKPNGNRRLVICYLSIGEAENYRYYWKNDWNTIPPKWLGPENTNWTGNFSVEYWNTEWQNIIYGTTDSYLDRILSVGFDGAYLDLIDVFKYYE
jgi:cysteinyl-tRNA synthetase, unknown class